MINYQIIKHICCKSGGALQVHILIVNLSIYAQPHDVNGRNEHLILPIKTWFLWKQNGMCCGNSGKEDSTYLEQLKHILLKQAEDFHENILMYSLYRIQIFIYTFSGLVDNK